MSEEVFLIHGLWMGPWVMHWLARELERAGYRTTTVALHTIADPLAKHIERIQTAVASSKADKIHLVGHSLGGVVLLHYLREAREARLKRAVLMGTPALGSEAARQFHRQPWGGLLGTSQDIWAGDFARAVDPRFEVGAIAGDQSFGLGAILVTLPQPSDGTVTVAETRIEGLRDHRVLPVSHTAMLFSGDVARQTIAFLKTGRFEP